MPGSGGTTLSSFLWLLFSSLLILFCLCFFALLIPDILFRFFALLINDVLSHIIIPPIHLMAPMSNQTK